MTYPPPPPPTPSTKKISKSIIIAIVIIAVLSFALIGTLLLSRPTNNSSEPLATITPTPDAISPTPSSIPSATAAPYDFEISTNYHKLNITQGNDFIVSVELRTINGEVEKIHTSDVVFTAISNSSGLVFDFDTTQPLYGGTDTNSSIDGFSTLLTIAAPMSVPTDNYSVTVKATIGSVSHSISITVSVQSKYVTVTGVIDNQISGVYIPTQIKFVNSTNQEVSAQISGNTYAISVLNHETYFIIFLNNNLTPYEVASRFYVDVPAGSNSITQNFILTG